MLDTNSPIWVLLYISPLVICLLALLFIRVPKGIREWDDRITEKFFAKAAAKLDKATTIFFEATVDVIIATVSAVWMVLGFLFKALYAIIVFVILGFLVSGVVGLLLFGIRQL